MKYFAYGMNTNNTQMARRCPDSVCLGPAWLPNYQLVFRGVADIEPAPDTWCDGVLWEISEQDLNALDVLEGYPYHYTRFAALVETDTDACSALVYQIVEQSGESPPSNYYLDMILEGYEQNGVPLDQLLENIELS